MLLCKLWLSIYIIQCQCIRVGWVYSNLRSLLWQQSLVNLTTNFLTDQQMHTTNTHTHTHIFIYKSIYFCFTLLSWLTSFHKKITTRGRLHTTPQEVKYATPPTSQRLIPIKLNKMCWAACQDLFNKEIAS